MYLFPAIDLLGGKVVRLVQGDYDRQTTYSPDPLDQAKRFADAGATWLHLVDLEGARSGKPVHLPIIERICAHTSLKVEVGGGIRNEQVIEQLLHRGVQRVILGTAALDNWDWFDALAHRPSLQERLVLGLDARGGKLAVAGWREQLQATALEVAQRVCDWPLAAIVYTDIATDGTLDGPNVQATRQIAEAVNVPVIASGGVGTLEHLRELRDLPLQGVIVGRALYDGAMSIEQALQTLEHGA